MSEETTPPQGPDDEPANRPEQPTRPEAHGPDRPSEEDVSRGAESVLGNGESGQTREISEREAHYIRYILTRLNVQGAEQATPEDIRYLWEKLGKGAPFILDYSLTIMSLKTELSLSALPMAIGMDDLFDYAEDIGNPRSLRNHIRSHGVPRLVDFGFDPAVITNNMYGEEEGKYQVARATRFLGWLADFNFMAGLKQRTKEYVEEHGIYKMRLSDVATVATLEVYDMIEVLEKKKYRPGYPMEAKSEVTREAALQALRGIRNLCQDLLLGGRSKESEN